MVHVWSINSGERFQGHHGPLVPHSGRLGCSTAFFGNLVRIQDDLDLQTIRKTASENFVEKGENASEPHFLPFP